jgi:hypothetical protein
MFDLLFGNTRAYDRRINDAFNSGELSGVERGIGIGMQRHFEVTSELSDDENSLLMEFLMRHNFVLCYDLQYGGFRVRKNDRLNPQKEKVIAVVDEDYKEGLKIKYIPLVQGELMKIKGEHRREESIKNRKSKR